MRLEPRAFRFRPKIASILDDKKIRTVNRVTQNKTEFVEEAIVLLKNTRDKGIRIDVDDVDE